MEQIRIDVKEDGSVIAYLPKEYDDMEFLKFLKELGATILKD